MRNPFEHALEARHLKFQVFCACRCQSVNPNAAVCRRNAPLGLDQVFFEEALERRIQRPFFALKQVMRSLFAVLYESVAVQRLASQGSENHHLQNIRKRPRFGFFVMPTESLAITCQTV